MVQYHTRQRQWVKFQLSGDYLEHLLENYGRLNHKLREFLYTLYKCRDPSEHIHAKFESWDSGMVILNKYDTELMDYETYCYNQWCLGRRQEKVDTLVLDYWQDFFHQCACIDNQDGRLVTLTLLNMIQDNHFDLVIDYVRGKQFNPHATFYLVHSYSTFISKTWLDQVDCEQALQMTKEQETTVLLFSYLCDQWKHDWCNIPEFAVSFKHIETILQKMKLLLSRVFAMRKINKWFAKEYALGGHIDTFLYAPPNGLMLRRGITECCKSNI
jgi:hypothetical protein